jgi:hypothetical protein
VLANSRTPQASGEYEGLAEGELLGDLVGVGELLGDTGGDVCPWARVEVKSNRKMRGKWGWSSSAIELVLFVVQCWVQH